LGAGVSQSAGLPLAQALLAAVAEETLKAPERAELDEFLEYLMPRFHKDLANYPDVEEFLSLLEVAESYAQFSRAGLAFRRRRLSKLRRTFLAGLAAYLWRGHESLTPDHPIALLAACLKRDDTVITFNYDLTIERALDNLGTHWGYRRELRPITVLKPHGSIDWFHADEVDAGRPGFSELLTDLTQVKGRKSPARRLGRRPPLIVPPVVGKLVQHPDLQDIWGEASAALIRADAIYILGYSLPEADRLTRLVLRHAVGIRSRSKSGNIWAVNPDRRLHERFDHCISPEVRFLEQPFERWVEIFHEREVALAGVVAQQGRAEGSP